MFPPLDCCYMQEVISTITAALLSLISLFFVLSFLEGPSGLANVTVVPPFHPLWWRPSQCSMVHCFGNPLLPCPNWYLLIMRSHTCFVSFLQTMASKVGWNQDVKKILQKQLIICLICLSLLNYNSLIHLLFLDLNCIKLWSIPVCELAVPIGTRMY